MAPAPFRLAAGARVALADGRPSFREDARLRPRESNTLADGFFHLSTWALIFTATLLSIRAWQRGELAPPWRAHFGMLLAGWGAFNVVEGLIDHQILGIHHVRDDLAAPLGWDLAFLAFGALLVIGGLGLARSGERAAGDHRPEEAVAT